MDINVISIHHIYESLGQQQSPIWELSEPVVGSPCGSERATRSDLEAASYYLDFSTLNSQDKICGREGAGLKFWRRLHRYRKGFNQFYMLSSCKDRLSIPVYRTCFLSRTNSGERSRDPKEDCHRLSCGFRRTFNFLSPNSYMTKF